VGITQKTFSSRFEQIKQGRANSQILDITKYEDVAKSPLIKPPSPKWSELCDILKGFVNLNGYLDSRIKYLFDNGYGAELVTASQIAAAKASKKCNYFTSMTSKSGGNWEKRTLETVKKAWEAQRNTLEVMERLQLDPASTKQILALSWRLKGRILVFLHMATRQNEGINNAKALFFWLTSRKKPKIA
jgi:hypothetical protein